MDFDAIEFDLKHFYISGERPKPLGSFTGTSNANIHLAGSNSDYNGKDVSTEDKENVATCKTALVSSMEDKENGAACKNEIEKLCPVLCMVRSKRPKNRVAGVLRHGARVLIQANLKKTDMATCLPGGCKKPYLDFDDGCCSTSDSDGAAIIQKTGVCFTRDRCREPDETQAQNSEDTRDAPNICHLAPSSALQQQGQCRTLLDNTLAPDISNKIEPFPPTTLDTNRMYHSFHVPCHNAIANTFATTWGNCMVEQRGALECKREIQQLKVCHEEVSPDGQEEKSTVYVVEHLSREGSQIHHETVHSSLQTVPAEGFVGPSPGNESDLFVRFFAIKLRRTPGDSHTARSRLTYTHLTNHLNGRPKTMSFNAYGSMVVEVLNKLQSDTLQQTTRLAGYKVSVTAHATLNTVTGVVWSDKLWNDGTEHDVIRQLDHEGVFEVTAIKCTKALNGSLICSAQVKFNQRTRLPSLVTTQRGFQLRAQLQLGCPKQCLKCFKFDHETFACHLHVALCENCAQPVSGHPQPCQRAKLCASCGGHHGALSTRCFVVHKAWRVCAVRTASNIDQADAERLVDREIVKCQKRGGDYCREYPVGGNL